ncbi:MAG: helix-turn-helix domain-containing protein [Acidimicrobiia bacterium]|nr:helix-turn-helix domain-containing protein [Acidimicrobiia bacterium]
MDVELIRWPSQRERRERLLAAGRPRLLLVEADAPAPVVTDLAEDWVRLPAERADLQARAESLLARLAGLDLTLPRIDEWGVVRYGGGHVTLPPLEARLASLLVAQFRCVTTRDQLMRAGWPGEDPGRNPLDVHILRLRRRVGPLGLRVRTVRSRGYLLEGETGSRKVAVPDR